MSLAKEDVATVWALVGVMLVTAGIWGLWGWSWACIFSGAFAFACGVASAGECSRRKREAKAKEEAPPHHAAERELKEL